MESLTFEQFEDQVMAAFDDWPIKCNDRSDADCVYYSFEAVNVVGPEGNYCNGEWTVSPKWSPDRVAKAESLEATIAIIEAMFND